MYCCSPGSARWPQRLHSQLPTEPAPPKGDVGKWMTCNAAHCHCRVRSSSAGQRAIHLDEALERRHIDVNEVQRHAQPERSTSRKQIVPLPATMQRCTFARPNSLFRRLPSSATLTLSGSRRGRRWKTLHLNSCATPRSAGSRWLMLARTRPAKTQTPCHGQPDGHGKPWQAS